MAFITPPVNNFIFANRAADMETIQQLLDMGLIDEVQARKMLGFGGADFQVRSEAVIIDKQEIFVWEY